MKESKQQNKALKMLRGYRAALWRKSALEVVHGTNNEALSVCLKQMFLSSEKPAIVLIENPATELW